MPRFSITVPDDLDDWLEEQLDEDDPDDSKSGTARRHLKRAQRLDEHEADLDDLVQAYERVDDLEAEVDDLRERLDSRADRIDQLEEQLARRSQVEEKVDVLAERVEDRERAADAPFFVRWARWFRSDDD
jgi:predicted ribosome quality control (RQC) complex YloA/Tae2 family protein